MELTKEQEALLNMLKNDDFLDLGLQICLNGESENLEVLYYLIRKDLYYITVCYSIQEAN